MKHGWAAFAALAGACSREPPVPLARASGVAPLPSSSAAPAPSAPSPSLSALLSRTPPVDRERRRLLLWGTDDDVRDAVIAAGWTITEARTYPLHGTPVLALTVSNGSRTAFVRRYKGYPGDLPSKPDLKGAAILFSEGPRFVAVIVPHDPGAASALLTAISGGSARAAR